MPTRLFKCLEAMTSHHDMALLDVGLVTSLRDLLGVNEIFLYDVARKSDQLLVAITTWSDASGIHNRHPVLSDMEYELLSTIPEISECIIHNKTVEIKMQTGAKFRQLIPVHVGNNVVACCEIHFTDRPSRYKKDLARGILGLYRNYLSLLEDCQTDTLTGLSNRKTFERSIAKLLVQAGDRTGARDVERRQRSSQEFWLVIIDIDNFKQINDRFGHLYGDEILMLLADLMRRTFRQNDHLFRFGGDEFIVLLRQVSYESASNTLERLRRQIASHQLPQVGAVTVSIGFTMISGHDLPNVVLGNADKALYHAKDSGRNQIQCYEFPVASDHFSGTLFNSKVYI